MCSVAQMANDFDALVSIALECLRRYVERGDIEALSDGFTILGNAMILLRCDCDHCERQ